jgi:hypothetical protein
MAKWLSAFSALKASDQSAKFSPGYRFETASFNNMIGAGAFQVIRHLQFADLF